LLVDKAFVQLPMVTLEQIELSREIQQFFTGDLEASVRFESNFLGIEKNLLRAQIQRISAGTQVLSFSCIFLVSIYFFRTDRTEKLF
jgi:hypothetical protein